MCTHTKGWENGISSGHFKASERLRVPEERYGEVCSSIRDSVYGRSQGTQEGKEGMGGDENK